MEKAFSLTVKYGAVAIIILAIVVGFSFDFSNNNIEVFHNLNEGKIKILGIFMVAIGSIFLFIVGGFQVQLKEKSIVIESQNKQLIQNGLMFVSGLQEVTAALNKNSATDIETLRLVTKLAHTVEKLETRMEDSEKKLLKHDAFIKDLES